MFIMNLIGDAVGALESLSTSNRYFNSLLTKTNKQTKLSEIDVPMEFGHQLHGLAVLKKEASGKGYSSFPVNCRSKL